MKIIYFLVIMGGNRVVFRKPPLHWEVQGPVAVTKEPVVGQLSALGATCCRQHLLEAAVCMLLVRTWAVLACTSLVHVRRQADCDQ